MSVAQYLTGIAEYIRMRLGNKKKYKLSEMEEGVNQVYEKAFSDGSADGYSVGFSYGSSEGYEQAVSDFWDIFQNYGERINYRYAFYESYPDKIFKPQYPFKCYGNCSNMFQYADMTKIDVDVDFSRFDTSKGAQCGGVFSNTYYLKSISKLIVHSGMTFNTWFTRVDVLEDITFDGTIGNDIDFKDCKKLTRASMKNIIGVLSDTAEGMAVTFSKMATDNAFSENEWNALIAQKPNWTFSLI